MQVARTAETENRVQFRNWLVIMVLTLVVGPQVAEAQFCVAGCGPYRLGWYPYSYRTGYFPFNYHYYYYDPAMALKQAWWTIEGRAFRKLEFERSTDERLARSEYERLVSLKEHLTRFVNGGTKPLDRAGFRAAITQVESTHSQTRFLQQEIQPIAPERLGEFASRGIVAGNGSLLVPPHVIYDRTDSDPSHEAYVRLKDAWRDARWKLIQGQMADPEDIDEMAFAVRVWRDRSHDRLVSARPSQRSEGKRYLKASERLVADLRDEVDSTRLTRHLNAGRRGFEGGTVGDYVRFVTDHKVNILYGSPSHQIIADLAYETLRNLDQQILALADKIERLKAQNPAHNAALKEQAIMANQTGWHAGYHDGHRPSLFNHPSQLQTSGLQSRAYGVEPQPTSDSMERYSIPASLRVSPAGRPAHAEVQRAVYAR